MSRLLRGLPVFSAVYAVLYAIAMYFNIAMFVYYPQAGAWHWHDTPGIPGPAMYWYGWIANAALGAVLVAAILATLPLSWQRGSALLSWLVPLGAMLTILFIIRGWFIR